MSVPEQVRPSVARPALRSVPSPRARISELRPRAPELPPTVVVGGLEFTTASRRQLAKMMVDDCLTRRRTRTPKLVFAVNGQTLTRAASDPKFREYFRAADIVHADGQPIVFASRWLTDTPIAERSATTDFFHDAAQAAQQHGLRFFLLGGTEEVNAQCADIMGKRYPRLEIVGRRHGYFTLAEEDEICEAINQACPDVVWVGLGVPLEQSFCARNKDRIQAGWILTAGGCYNFVTGHYRRAPSWMQSAGLEWLYRIWREPRRLFWRYAVTNPHALFLLLSRTRAAMKFAHSDRVGPQIAEINA